MGTDYALVHVKYTIPPAVLLTLLYRPLWSKLDTYRVGFLITVAVTATIPWDSYLIRTGIWSYPSHVIIGPTLFNIPLEEVFFFVIQTYNTSLLYFLLSKPTYQPTYLRAATPSSPAPWKYSMWGGQAVISALIAYGWYCVKANVTGTYTGLILVWAGPVLLGLWTLAYQFILGLPLSNTALPIWLPTLYLWVVDTMALRRGTWVISAGTKHGIHLWDGLEIEEALFFLVTNMLIVFGLVAFDNAIAILHTFPALFPNPAPQLPSPVVLIQALFVSPKKYDDARLEGLREAVHRLKRKSRSFYLASSTFQGLLRTDLLLLYSFCRVADDLVDNAATAAEAKEWIAHLNKFLDLAYSGPRSRPALIKYVFGHFPADTRSALVQLPTEKLSRKPLQDLLLGFDMDLAFDTASPPITNEDDLKLYAERVAGTVAQMCIELIFRTYTTSLNRKEQHEVEIAGNSMGVALQYVNIARDIAVDAKIGRVYLPTTWLSEAGLTQKAVLEQPSGPRVESIRNRLLDNAFDLYNASKHSIEQLPSEAAGPIRVAVESYMEIGRTLRQKGYMVKAGRATVPKWRRLLVAWQTLNQTSKSRWILIYVAVPDNYTDEKTFLDHLQRNPRLQPYEFWSLMADTTIIVQHLASVAIFCCCFVAIIQGNVSPLSVVGWATLCTALAWILWDHWQGKHLEESTRPSETDEATDSQSDSVPSPPSRRQQRISTIKSAVLIYAALLGLSPILKSLTKSTTSDSIWAISTWLLMMNVVFFDYSSGPGAQ
ncbi:Squalene/phytoene synthase-domain-containing protein [Boeremia exigua]|uniref:Squalene/phytoene synthase-domain-containing protein n=1 Tax=Boeremia exigua TaxID=749465 RepID=UPI001E8DD746|nr:Squalene/phytoene synthase-domain-containing protein [Boeremia exigua]KAH6620191.1 Squalene/phytoene synthase-domain-containing protein [Boeremia exigua]